MSDQAPRIDDLRRRVLRDPASIAFAQLAEEYRRAGAYESAVEVCRTGLARHPGYLSARVTLGRALLELGHVDAACTELQAVLAGSPNNQAALRGLGEVFHKRGELDQALEHYRRALALGRTDPELQQLVADLTRLTSPTPATPAPQPVAPASKPDFGGLLSLEDLAAELQRAALGPPVPRPKASPPEPTSGTVATFPSPEQSASAESKDSPETEADRHLLASMERWLTAIDGFRAEHRP